MKRILQKLLVCILIVTIVSNFALSLNGSEVYAEGEFSLGATFSNVLTGIIGVLTWLPMLPVTALVIGVSDIIGAVAKVSIGDISSYGGAGIDWLILTPFHILFNKVPLVDVNFFNIDEVSGTILKFRQAVAGWYYTMRLIAVMVLAVVLIYIGIRMALSTIASEKAMYKKMLVDWVTSLCLLFVLHYIIIFIISCNEALVNAMAATEPVGLDVMITALQALCFHYDIVTRVAALVIYGMIVFQTISFLISYIKRMFTIGFLIIISPLITITYSIDKIGDGKAQALNTWLKEFSYNILLQPFQCILYLVFAKLALDEMLADPIINLSTSNVGKAVFAILSLWFIKDGEKIVKKIFGFGKADTAGDFAAGAALTGAALLKGKDIARKHGGSIMKAKNTIMSSKAMSTLKSGMKNSAVGKAATKVSDAAKSIKSKAAQKFTSSESMKKRKERKEEAFEERISKKAQEEWNKQGHTGEPSEQFKSFIREREEKKKEKRKIDKPAGFVKSAFKASGEAIGGLNEMIKDHKKDIGKMVPGMLMMGMGMGSGEFGDLSKAMIGYNYGSGFAEGMYANSASTLKSDYGGYVQMINNLAGQQDTAGVLADAQVAGDNDISKEIKDSLKNLQTLIRNMEGKSRMMGSFSSLVLNKETAGTITRDKISDMLDENGFKGSDAEKEKVIDAFSAHGVLLGQQLLHTGIENAVGMGLDRDDMANLIGEKRPITSETNTYEREETETETTEVHYENLPIDELVRHITANIAAPGAPLNVTNLDETNRKIDELNRLIENLETSDASRQSEIVTAIRQSNSNIKSYNDMMQGLESQLTSLQEAKTKFEGHSSNN